MNLTSFEPFLSNVEASNLMSSNSALRTFKNKVDVSVFNNNDSVLWLEEKIEELAHLKDFTKTEDYKHWGFLPGQQIYYGGAFGLSKLTHHAIYVHEGVVLEVGSGSTSECKTGQNLFAFKDQTYGFSTLKNFNQRAKKLKSDVALLITENDTLPQTIFERLSRAKDLVGCYNYNIVENNCQHAANYVSFGTKYSTQAKTAKIVIVSLLATGALAAYYKNSSHCLRGTCKPRVVTKNKCICSSSVFSAILDGKRWCYVDGCTGRELYNGQPFDYVNDETEQEYCQEAKTLKYRKCGDSQTNKS